MPKTVLNVNLTPNQGRYTFDSVTKLLVWDVGKMESHQSRSGPMIKGTIVLQSGAPVPDSNPNILVKFTISQFTISDLKVNRLDMFGEVFESLKIKVYAFISFLFSFIPEIQTFQGRKISDQNWKFPSKNIESIAKTNHSTKNPYYKDLNYSLLYLHSTSTFSRIKILSILILITSYDNIKNFNKFFSDQNHNDISYKS